MPEKKKTKKPLERHKLVLKRISENIRKGMTMEQAMLKENYSPSYAKSSTHLKETKSWETLLKEQLPDDLLTKKHKQLLEKEQIFAKNNNKTGEIDIIRTGEIDPNAVSKGLDMAYKLKNKYAPEEYNLKFKGFSKSQLIDSIMSKITKKK